MKIASDTNHQCHYVGDGDGDVSLAGLGIPPISLTDGALPGAEMLFKQGLHSMKGLVNSQVYLKNPKSAEAEASRQQSALLESINHANGKPSNTIVGTIIGGDGADKGSDSSPVMDSPKLTDDDNDDESKKKKKLSPAAAMAEAQLLSQKAPVQEAANLSKFIELQEKE